MEDVLGEIDERLSERCIRRTPAAFPPRTSTAPSLGRRKFGHRMAGPIAKELRGDTRRGWTYGSSPLTPSIRKVPNYHSPLSLVLPSLI